MKGDTIAAISTAAGGSGIGIIRVSGSEAISVVDRVYRSKKNRKRIADQDSHTVHYGYIYDGDDPVDEVLVVLMRAPRSFTAEDTVEINCHGGVYAMKKVLDAVIKHGARPAEPGEFTKRAFLNGRLDLSQAEAVMDIIQSENEYALQSSLSQLKGSVFQKIKRLREDILYEIAFIESALDDPEHISLEGYPEGLAEKTGNMLKELKNLIVSADNGRLIKEGVQTVILGKPNAGKSSLMNALIGEERAIVTNIAGTTRDTLEETIHFEGITLKLIDTAGIRQSEDMVEKIGVERAKEKAANADLILYVVDSSRNLDQNDEAILDELKTHKAIILLNKCDLDQKTKEEDIKKLIKNKKLYCNIISISIKEQTGIEKLQKKIQELFFKGEINFNDEVFITNIRQKELLNSALDSLYMAQTSIQNQMPEDFYSIDMIGAYEELGSIIGETVGEDLVNEIFSKFCLGK